MILLFSVESEMSVFGSYCCHQVVIEHERKERSNMEAHLRQKMHELLDRQSKVDMQESDFSSR